MAQNNLYTARIGTRTVCVLFAPSVCFCTVCCNAAEGTHNSGSSCVTCTRILSAKDDCSVSQLYIIIHDWISSSADHGYNLCAVQLKLYPRQRNVRGQISLILPGSDSASCGHLRVFTSSG